MSQSNIRPPTLIVVDRMRRSAQSMKNSRNHSYSKYTRAVRQVLFLPWTEYDRDHTPEYKWPKDLVKDRRELMERYNADHPFTHDLHCVIVPSTLKKLETESHILGYFIEIY